MDDVDLSALTEAELEDRNRDLMAQRGEAEQGFKAQQRAVTAELDRRAATARAAKALEGLAPEDRIAVLDTLKAG